jgi:hypothetical protein
MDSILLFISEDHEMTIRQLNDEEWLGGFKDQVQKGQHSAS